MKFMEDHAIVNFCIDVHWFVGSCVAGAANEAAL